MTSTALSRVILFSDDNGYAQFRDETQALDVGSPVVRLSAPEPCRAFQLRVSPVGYESDFHSSESPMLVLVLAGGLEVELRDGSRRIFTTGDHFLADDRVPPGQSFDPQRHGHRSRQVGDIELVTAFIWL